MIVDGMPVSSEREWFNPVEEIERLGLNASHITYDPEVVPQYRIIREATHDGTMAFTLELFDRALLPLALSASYYVEDGPILPREELRYVVGRGRRATVFGRVSLPVGNYPGQHERITIPVRVVRSLPEEIA